PNGEYYWRLTQYFLPIFGQIPVRERDSVQMWMPIDDHHCWRYTISAGPPTLDNAASERIMSMTEPGTYRFDDGKIIDTHLPIYRRENNYGMDRERQRTLSFTGMPIVPTQDQAMNEGMGYICDRTQEHLGTSDVAVIAMRR